MNPDPIVFAMANPDPEVSPEEAAAYARVVATGRSDYPNQINNVLCFPGIFRGALDVRATQITEEMKTAAARAIADIVSVDELREDYIIPSVFNREVVGAVASAVAEEARESGTAEAGAEVGFAPTEEFADSARPVFGGACVGASVETLCAELGAVRLSARPVSCKLGPMSWRCGTSNCDHVAPKSGGRCATSG